MAHSNGAIITSKLSSSRFSSAPGKENRKKKKENEVDRVSLRGQMVKLDSWDVM
jgi:hypothetical protein